MKSIIDRNAVKTRATLSNVASLGGLLLLLGSVALSLYRPALATLTTILMLAGAGISMVGIYYANRWVKKPRPEDSLDAALKGYGDSYRLYHYPKLPCDHVLLGPNGMVVIETVNLEGKFTYREGKWRQMFTFGRALRWMVEEHLGDPIRAATECADYLSEQVSSRLNGGGKFPVDAAVVFTHRAVQLEVEGARIPVVELAKLKKKIDFKRHRLAPEVYQCAQEYMDQCS